MRSIFSSIISAITMLALGAIWLLPQYFHWNTGSMVVTLVIQTLSTLVIMLLCGLFLYKKSNRNKPAASTMQKPVKKQRLKRFWHFLSKQSRRWYYYCKDKLKPTVRKRNQLLTDLPWYLLIGNHQSGKSTLINQSDLSLLPTDSLQNLSMELNYAHTWHLAKEAVLLELAYENSGFIPEVFWNNLIKFSRRYRKKTYFNGIIFAIDLSELMSAYTYNKESAQLLSIKTIFHHLSHILKTPMPVYLVLTKGDQISGFQEFFSDLNMEERQQILGIIFSKSAADDLQFQDLFNKEYETFLSRLNHRLFKRLDTERDVNKRAILSYFPQQLRILKKILAELIIQDKRTQLQGIFFTSGLQEGANLNMAMSLLAARFHLEEPEKIEPIAQKKSFFIKSLFTDVILPENNWVFQTADWRRRDLAMYRATLVTSVMTLVIGVILLSMSFTNNSRKITSISEATPLYNQAIHEFALGKRRLYDLVPALVELNTIQDLYARQNRSWLTNLEFYQPWSIHHQLHAVWQQNLAAAFMPRVASRLEDMLQDNQLSDEVLYQALKGYFVFSPSNPVDPNWLKAPISYDLSVNLRDQIHEQILLSNYLAEAIQFPLPTFMINKQLVDQARLRLKAVPPVQFSYYEIKQAAENSNDQINLAELSGNNFPNVFSYSDNNIKKLPHFYTLKGYESLRGQRSQDFIKQSAQTYKILGINPTINADNLSAQMTPELWEIYSSDYIDHWQKYLTNLHIINFSNLNEAIQSLNAVLNVNSPVMKLLAIVKANTESLDADHVQVAKQFASLNALTANGIFHKDTPAPYDEITKNLQSLRDYLIGLNNSSNIDQSEFQESVAIMSNKLSTNPILVLRHQAAQLPAPLGIWLTQIADNSLDLLLKGARRTINTAWQANVLPFYKANIHSRFPFSSDKTKVIDLDNFSNFFGGKGIFNQFFQTYLAPFIDTSHGVWQLNQIDNISLQLPETTLKQIFRISLISNMFFQNGDNKPFMQFHIQPLFLDAESSSVYVQLANQTLTYRHGPQQMINWNWPGNEGSQQVSVSFSDFQGQNFSKSLDGPWAWFEMLNQTALATRGGNGHYIWTLNQNQHKASFNLIAQNNFPLFDLKALRQFNLPDGL